VRTGLCLVEIVYLQTTLNGTRKGRREKGERRERRKRRERREKGEGISFSPFSKSEVAPPSTTIGLCAICAFLTAVIVFVNPGPAVTDHKLKGQKDKFVGLKLVKNKPAQTPGTPVSLE
jgi:hypothetical protein